MRVAESLDQVQRSQLAEAMLRDVMHAAAGVTNRLDVFLVTGDSRAQAMAAECDFGVIEDTRKVIGQIDSGIPLAKVSTLATLTSTAMAGERFSMLLVSSFGILAVLLAAVGLYGVISYSVAQRTREIGIRVALGAQRGDVFSMIICHGLGLSGLGILIGIVAALGMAKPRKFQCIDRAALAIMFV